MRKKQGAKHSRKESRPECKKERQSQHFSGQFQTLSDEITGRFGRKSGPPFEMERMERGISHEMEDSACLCLPCFCHSRGSICPVLAAAGKVFRAIKPIARINRSIFEEVC